MLSILLRCNDDCLIFASASFILKFFAVFASKIYFWVVDSSCQDSCFTQILRGILLHFAVSLLYVVGCPSKMGIIF